MQGRDEISNAEDVIDSRDVIARIEYLESEEERTEEETEELEALKALAAEASDYAPDWKHGETLIRASYFREYAEELASDCGMIPVGLVAWPCTHIDWEAAANELKGDYTEVDFGGVAYFIR